MIEQLLEFEEKIEVLEYKFGKQNLIIWPFIRCFIFEKIMYSGQANKAPQTLNIMVNQIDRIVHSIFKLNRNLGTCKMLFLYDSVSNIKTDEGKYFNRLFDYYAQIYENETVMVESCYINGYQSPRYFKKIHYFQRSIDRRRIKSRIKKTNPEDSIKIEAFLNYLKVNFPIKLKEEDLILFEKRLHIIANSLDDLEYDYKRLFNKYKPKIIFVEDALYGGYNAHIVKLAKEMGIKTAEFQHGMVYMNHAAYSYSNQICENTEYKLYTPDYFLTMGQYWNNNCKIPSESRVIGAPHLYYNVNKYNKSKKNNCNSKQKILIVGAINHEDYINYAKEIHNQAPNKYEVIIKVHPAFLNSKYLYKDIVEDAGVRIVFEGDVYDYISKADWVIGDCSTVLYEAVGFGKNVIIIENEASEIGTPKEFGVWVNSVEELLKVIDEQTKNESIVERNYFWESKWELNFTTFLKEIDVI